MERFEIIKVARDIQQPTERTYLLESQVGKPVVQGSDANKKSILRFLAALSIGVVVHFALAAIAIRVVDVDVDVDVPIRSKINQESNKPGEISSNKTALAQAKYVSFRFEEKLQPFSKNILAGYSSCEDLIQDVQHALESLANEQIESQRNIDCNWNPNGPSKEENAYPCQYLDDRTNDFKYSSNLQMDSVEEAELIKSNGNYVFMGHGREVVVLDSNGTVVDRVEVPPLPSDTQTFFVDKDNKSSSTAREVIWPCGPPEPRYRRVVSLLMHEDDTTGVIMLNVMAIVHYPNTTFSFLTTAFVYNFAEGTLKLVSSQDINGIYKNAFAIGSINHIITEADTLSSKFMDLLHRRRYWNMTKEQYEQAAFAKANEAVASFAKDIVNGLSLISKDISGNACKYVAQISSITTGDEFLTREEKQSGRNMYRPVIKTFVQITSFDLGRVTPKINSDQHDTVDAYTAGAFVETWQDSYLYANSKNLVLLAPSRRYHSSGRWDQYTYIISFDFSNGVMAFPKAVAEVLGHPCPLYAYFYSINIYQNSLRVVTVSDENGILVKDENTGKTSWYEAYHNPSYQVAILQDNGVGELIQVSLIEIQVPGIIFDVCLVHERGYVLSIDSTAKIYSFDLSNPMESKTMAIMDRANNINPINFFPISGGNGTQVVEFLLTLTCLGTRLGTKITVFDVRDTTNAKEVAYYITDDCIYRGELIYLQDSNKLIIPTRVEQESNKLIIPMRVEDDDVTKYDLSNGFVVLNIDIPNKNICVTGNVTHTEGQANYNSIWDDPTISLYSLQSMKSYGYLYLTMHNIKMLKDVNNLIGDLWTQVNLDTNCSQHEQLGI